MKPNILIFIGRTAMLLCKRLALYVNPNEENNGFGRIDLVQIWTRDLLQEFCTSINMLGTG